MSSTPGRLSPKAATSHDELWRAVEEDDGSYEDMRPASGGSDHSYNTPPSSLPRNFRVAMAPQESNLIRRCLHDSDSGCYGASPASTSRSVSLRTTLSNLTAPITPNSSLQSSADSSPVCSPQTHTSVISVTSQNDIVQPEIDVAQSENDAIQVENDVKLGENDAKLSENDGLGENDLMYDVIKSHDDIIRGVVQEQLDEMIDEMYTLAESLSPELC